MDYEKMYKEALEKARKKYNAKYHPDMGPGGVYLNNADLKEIFPELRESEDERIMGCIGVILTDATEQRFTDFGVSLKDCLAWLEKQKEQKPVDFPTTDEEVKEFLETHPEEVEVPEKYKTPDFVFSKQEYETAITLADRIADTYGTQRYMDGLCDGVKHVQPEMDFEEEIDKWLKAGPITDTRYDDYCDDDIQKQPATSTNSDLK